jgi:DNA recombination protein RmuC
MTRFNETVGSYERSVLTAARRFDDLGIAESTVPEPAVVEATVRSLRPGTPTSPGSDDALDEESELSEARDGTRG